MPAKKIDLKKKSTKKKKTAKKSEAPKVASLLKTSIKWDDAYPCLLETFKFGKETFEVKKYYSSADKDIDTFLLEAIRTNQLPSFIKINFRKIKKFIEREISHRDKIYEKLDKEQVIAFQSYFKDVNYFDRDDADEYFQYELEKVYLNYLKAYLDTGLYESRARSHNRKRRTTLERYGVYG